MKTNCDVTIYNRLIKNRETVYQRSYIYGAHWEDTKGANIIASGLTTADAVVLIIPFSSGGNYKKPKEFKKAPEGFFTLQTEDVIVKGIIEDDFVTVKKLEEKYDDVKMITTVDTMDYGSEHMKHWEVGGV